MSTSLPPASVQHRNVGPRELALLLIASGFAFLMLDLGDIAIVTGWAVVALWAYAMLRGPRPTPVLSFVYGAGLFVTTFWWPEEGWWLGAIALMWVGVGLMVFAMPCIMWLRLCSRSGKRIYNP